MQNKNKVTKLNFKKISKSLDGNIIIADHQDIYFIISPEKRKITLFTKRDLGDKFFSTQRRFLEFAIKKGMIVLGSESTGYLPGTFEFLYPESEKNKSLIVMLKLISKFLSEENEHYKKVNEMEQAIEKRLLEPDDEHSTELGEIPHEDKKGGMVTNPYMNYINSWFGWYI